MSVPADTRAIPPNRGTRTREAILARAVEVASVQGLEGLSIGALASDMEMSKSGLFAHFGSKEELQLATLAAAREVFIRAVVEIARGQPRGVPQLAALVSGYLKYSEQRIFPAGCFFFGATREFSGKPGSVREEAVSQMTAWLGLLEENVSAAVELGELDPETDPEALSFELIAFTTTANWLSGSLDRPKAYADARRAIVAALLRCRADAAQLEILAAAAGPRARRRR